MGGLHQDDEHTLKNSRVGFTIKLSSELYTTYVYRLLSWKGRSKVQVQTNPPDTTSIGDAAKSIEVLEDTYNKALLPEDRAQCLRIQSQNQFVLRDFSAALRHILSALNELGIKIDANVSRKDADALFQTVKNQVLQRGFDSILAIPKTTDKRARLVVQLLNDACKHRLREKWHDI